MIDEELFYAWLDGELDGEEAGLVAARVAADPKLQAKAEQHRVLAAQLRGAFAPVLEQIVPPPAFASAEVVDFRARRAERRERRSSFGVPQWAAMAATLAIGIVAGQFVNDRSGAPIESRDGRLVASASLDKALETQLASANGDGRVRIGLTFRTGDGTICRSFTNDSSSGLACRHGEDWRVEGLFAAPEGQQGEADRKQVLARPGDKPGRSPHRREIGSDVEGVGEDQQPDEGQHQGARKDLEEVGRQTLAGHASDARADRLDRRHQRISEHQAPQNIDAELRARLGIRRDPTRIVVRSAGDETWA